MAASGRLGLHLLALAAMASSAAPAALGLASSSLSGLAPFSAASSAGAAAAGASLATGLCGAFQTICLALLICRARQVMYAMTVGISGTAVQSSALTTPEIRWVVCQAGAGTLAPGAASASAGFLL